MQQECRHGSFKFQRNSSTGSSNRSNGQEQCRKRLKDKFDECEQCKGSPEKHQERTALSMLNLDDTRKYFRNSAERLTRTLHSVRVTLGTLSQRFKTVTKRRQILEEGPMTPNAPTPYTQTRQVLGRTPTKLYSPFGIDSPYHPTTTTTIDKENVPVFGSLVKR